MLAGCDSPHLGHRLLVPVPGSTRAKIHLVLWLTGRGQILRFDARLWTVPPPRCLGGEDAGRMYRLGGIQHRHHRSCDARHLTDCYV